MVSGQLCREYEKEGMDKVNAQQLMGVLLVCADRCTFAHESCRRRKRLDICDQPNVPQKYGVTGRASACERCPCRISWQRNALLAERSTAEFVHR